MRAAIVARRDEMGSGFGVPVVVADRVDEVAVADTESKPRDGEAVPEVHTILCSQEIRVVLQAIGTDQMPKSIAVYHSVPFKVLKFSKIFIQRLIPIPFWE